MKPRPHTANLALLIHVGCNEESIAAASCTKSNIFWRSYSSCRCVSNGWSCLTGTYMQGKATPSHRRRRHASFVIAVRRIICPVVRRLLCSTMQSSRLLRLDLTKHDPPSTELMNSARERRVHSKRHNIGGPNSTRFDSLYTTTVQ